MSSAAAISPDEPPAFQWVWRTDQFVPKIAFLSEGQLVSGVLECQYGDGAEWFIDKPGGHQGEIIYVTGDLLSNMVDFARNLIPPPDGAMDTGEIKGPYRALVDDTLDLYVCDTCNGGEIYNWPDNTTRDPCPTCDGTGLVPLPKDDRRREIERLDASPRAKTLILGMRTTTELEADPRSDDLIPGLIPSGATGFLYGFRSTGKTFVAISIAAAIAAGVDWYGHPVTQGVVVYQASEGQGGLGQRGAAWRANNDLDEIPNLIWLPERIWLADERCADDFVEAVAYRQPALVVVDTLAQAMLGIDENTSAMGRAIEVADRIRTECGAATMFIHHLGSDGKRMRGHTSLDNAAEFLIRCDRKGRIVTLTNEKQKDAVEHVPMQFVTRELAGSLVLDPLTNHGVSSPVDDDPLLSVICQCGVSSGVVAADAIEKAGLNERTGYRRLKRLQDQGFIRNVGTERAPRWQAIEEITP